MTFDTLSFSKRLQAAGVPTEQAEAHALAQGEFLTDHLLSFVATKEDLKASAMKEDLKAFATKEDLKAFATKEDLKAFATKEDLKAFATKEDLKAFATKEDLKAFASKEEFRATQEDVKAIRKEMNHMETRLRLEMQLLGKTLTVRLGGIVVLGIGALAALNQL